MGLACCLLREMVRVVLVLLLAGLLLLLEPVAASDSAFAAAAMQSKQNYDSGAGMSKGDKKKGRGKGQLTDWAKKLRGQLPGMFDDKAAKRIFDGAAASAGAKMPKLSVDDLKAKGWHYQIQGDDEAKDASTDSRDVKSEALKSAYGHGRTSAMDTKTNPKANVSPELEVKDAEKIKKDEEKYAKAKAWRERMSQNRKVRESRRRRKSGQVSALRVDNGRKRARMCSYVLTVVITVPPGVY